MTLRVLSSHHSNATDKILSKQSKSEPTGISFGLSSSGGPVPDQVLAAPRVEPPYHPARPMRRYQRCLPVMEDPKPLVYLYEPPSAHIPLYRVGMPPTLYTYICPFFLNGCQ